MKDREKNIGFARLLSKTEYIAGEPGSIHIVYTAGRYGIEEGGHLRIAWRGVSDWQNPQFDHPLEEGYTTVTTSGNATLKIDNSPYMRPFVNSILISVYDGYIREGEQIHIILGDTSKGSPGMKTQTYAEKNHELLVLVDSYASYRYEETAERLKINVLPGKAHEIQLVVPGTVPMDEDFEVLFRAIDRFGNPTDDIEGTFMFWSDDSDQVVYPPDLSIGINDTGTKIIGGFKIKSKGKFHLCAANREGNLVCRSNASVSEANPRYKLLWGDMHAQNADTVGTGTLDEYYRFARDKAGLDFTGWQGNDFDMDDGIWESVKEYTKTYNSPGRFTVFLGYEWSALPGIGGDHNVFFLGDDEEKYYPCSTWMSKGTLEKAEITSSISELYNRYNNREDVLIIPHIGGRHARLDHFQNGLSSVIEIHSHHGIFEWFALDAMKKRLKVGFIASSDDHTGRPGLSYPLNGNGDARFYSFNVISGLTGVYAENNSREAIWKALKNRRCYASTNERIWLKTDIDGNPMGSEIYSKDKIVFNIEAVAASSIDEIVLYDWDKTLYRKKILEADDNTLRIRWGGVTRKGRNRSAVWNGKAYIKNGKVIDAVDYAIDRADQGITEVTDQCVQWISSTTGDYDGVVLHLLQTPETSLEIYTEQGNAIIQMSDIGTSVKTIPFGGENLKMEIEYVSKEYLKEGQKTEGDYYKDSFELPVKGSHAIWAKIVTIDGQQAWASPIFVN